MQRLGQPHPRYSPRFVRGREPGFGYFFFFSIKARPYRGARQLNDARRFLRKIDRCGENKNKFPHTYALLELPSKDNSLAAEGPSRCVMRDFIAVTGIGRGHRAHALSPRFCLTDYFIYGQQCVYIYIYIRGRASWLCARRRALKSACKTLLPAAAPDSIKTPGVSDRRPPPGIRSYAGICMEIKKERDRSARRMTLSTRGWTCARTRAFRSETLFFNY